MRSLWPVGEAAQADYEALRDAALAGVALHHPAAIRFERAGLAGLVGGRSAARPVYLASIVGAARPPWTPYADPRVETLAQVYALALGVAEIDRVVKGVSR